MSLVARALSIAALYAATSVTALAQSNGAVAPSADETSLSDQASYVGDTATMQMAAKENIEELLIQKDDDGFIFHVEWRDLRLCDEKTNPDCLDIEKTFRLNSKIASKRFWHKANPFKFLDRRTAGEISQAWLDTAQKLNRCQGVPYRWVF